MTTYPIDSSAAEKFLNMMLFWSSWHATGLPPEDYWLAGHSLSYYYWGHFHWAWLGHAGGFPGAIPLNLAFARAVTQVFEACGGQKGHLCARPRRLSRTRAVFGSDKVVFGQLAVGRSGGARLPSPVAAEATWGDP